jgi:PadR family transcriptional regulator PadR
MSQRSGDNPAVERWEVQARKGVLELVVLAALWSGRLYGLELIRKLEDEAQLAVPEGTLYPLLNRLRAEGQVDAEWVEADAGHPRKYYRLTADGRRRVVQMTRFWRGFATGIDAVLRPVPAERRK